MKNIFASFCLFLALSTGAFAQTAPKPALKTAKDSASYAFGIMQAQRMKPQLGNDYSLDLFSQGMAAGLKSDTTTFSPMNAQKFYGDYNRALQMKAGEANIAEGKAFLEKNKLRKEVKTTASGLQYEVLKTGTGTVSPLATDKVKVHYHGTLINGEVFDSSVDRGQPATFGLNQVIKGWTEGVQLMHVGDKFKFFLPYDLAYGDRGAGAKIKPFSALVFEVELLEINPK